MLQNKIIWIIVIFLSAALFRLTNLDLIEFKLDEARDVYEMERFFKEPYFIQRGTIQSTGVYNPPIWYYFLAVLSIPSRNPQYLSFMIALLNCIAVAGFYWVVQRFYGQFIGVASGLLIAFSPWAILLSRKIWAPDLILLLVVPLFYCINVILRGSSKQVWFWVVLLLSLLAQLHSSGLFLGLASIIIINIIFELGFYQFLNERKAIQGDFGSIFRVTNQAAEQKLANQKDDPNYDLKKAEFFVKLFSGQVPASQPSAF